ncbi:MAG: ATP-binding cassette domain-containing protein [Anaerolineae bacterium]|nr:ATP-binding cassette domain-containing protein [Anaerolineae bacterium]
MDYEKQQEEIKELQQNIRIVARQVGHNRPSRDREKRGFDAKGERVQQTVSRNVRAAEEQLRRIEANPIPRPPAPMHINPRFNTEALEAAKVISVSNLTKGFDNRLVLRNVNFTVGSDARILIVGPNGVGKTTLFKIIMDLEKADSGKIHIAKSARIGYLPQETHMLNADKTVLENYKQGLNGNEENFISDLLRYGLFRYDDLQKSVRQLSVGQCRKLQIARLIANSPNVLLLDEPTNHISLDVLEAFEASIVEFPGPIIAISHDRWFAERYEGQLWELTNGTLRIQQSAGEANF